MDEARARLCESCLFCHVPPNHLSISSCRSSDLSTNQTEELVNSVVLGATLYEGTERVRHSESDYPSSATVHVVLDFRFSISGEDYNLSSESQLLTEYKFFMLLAFPDDLRVLPISFSDVFCFLPFLQRLRADIGTSQRTSGQPRAAT